MYIVGPEIFSRGVVGAVGMGGGGVGLPGGFWGLFWVTSFCEFKNFHFPWGRCGWVQTPDPPQDLHTMYMHFGIPQETPENCLLSRVTLQWQTLKRTTSTDHRQAKNTKVFWEALNFPKLIVSGTNVLVFLVLCQHSQTYCEQCSFIYW